MLKKKNLTDLYNKKKDITEEENLNIIDIETYNKDIDKEDNFELKEKDEEEDEEEDTISQVCKYFKNSGLCLFYDKMKDFSLNIIYLFKR